ncbi:hypothetical protein TL16_g11861 [Triparma laevis f. inornata]|uniref:LIM zinc-binding domain-containing protein n=1 Tax=Triparma laevis f. inornata TaxID=1714386 RepID=A0A9W7BHW6_9STRA|nr:hypothetical protein TL16_g11861 [Triparma laevis f. inornata]
MASKCSVCTKSVYPNDPKIVLDGCTYHKSCAKCVDCSCQITISNFTKVGTELLCRTHNLERFHKNNSYVGGEKFKHKEKTGGADSGSVASTSSMKEDMKQVREQETVFKFRGDDKKVESAEPRSIKTQDTNATSPTPVSTRLKSTSIADRAAAFGGTSLTPSPTNRPKLGSELSTSSVNSTSSVSSTGSIKDRMSAFSKGSGGSGKCPVCSKTVYPADAQITLDGIKYHKPCAKCVDCNCQITLSNFTKIGVELLCRTHNLERFHKDNSYVGGEKFEHKSKSSKDICAEVPKGEPIIVVVEEGKVEVEVEVVKIVEKVKEVTLVTEETEQDKEVDRVEEVKKEE